MKRLILFAVLVFGAEVSAATKTTFYKLSPWATLLLAGIVIVFVLMVRWVYIAKQRLEEEDADRRRSAEDAADKTIEDEWDEPELVGTPETPEIVMSHESRSDEEDAIPITDNARHLEG